MELKLYKKMKEYADDKRRRFETDPEGYTFSFQVLSEKEKDAKKLEILKLVNENKIEELQNLIKDSFTNHRRFSSSSIREVIEDLREKELLEISFESYLVNPDKKLVIKDGEIIEEILILLGVPRITEQGIEYIREYS